MNDILKKIAMQITGIPSDDLTKAEKNIAKILVAEEILIFDSEYDSYMFPNPRTLSLTQRKENA